MIRFQSFAIVPAAGKSKRMGAAKLLLPWRGRALIDHLLLAWKRSDVGRVIVVARADDTTLLDHLRAHDVDVVVPANPPPEMKDSVAAALMHIHDHYAPEPSDAWLLAPADLPQLSKRVINQVLDARRATRGSIVVPSFQRRRGHPVLFPWALHRQVFDLGPDQGVRELLRHTHVTEVETSESASWSDVDRPEDYRHLQARQTDAEHAPDSELDA